MFKKRKGKKTVHATGKAGDHVLVSSLPRRIIVCAVMGICLALPMLYVNDVMGYLSFIAFVLTIALSYGYLVVLKHNLVFEETSDYATCERGGSLDFVVTVKNKSILLAPKIGVCFYISDLFKEGGSLSNRTISLNPRSQKDFEFALRFDHIGMYQAGLKEIVVTDLFGLFSAHLPNTRICHIEVEPKIFDVEQLQLSTETVQESKTSLVSSFNDGMDYCGVKEYTMGDPMKAIHWNLSAIYGKLYTKVYETLGNPGLSIIANFNAPPYDNEALMNVFDTVVEASFSLMEYAQEQGMDTALSFMNQKQLYCRTSLSKDDYLSVVREMPLVFSGEDHSVEQMVEQELNSLQGRSNVAIVTSQVNDLLIDALARLKAQRRNPVVLLVVPPHLGQDERKALTKSLYRIPHIAYVVLESAQQLEECEGEAA